MAKQDSSALPVFVMLLVTFALVGLGMWLFIKGIQWLVPPKPVRKVVAVVPEPPCNKKWNATLFALQVGDNACAVGRKSMGRPYGPQRHVLLLRREKSNLIEASVRFKDVPNFRCGPKDNCNFLFAFDSDVARSFKVVRNNRDSEVYEIVKDKEFIDRLLRSKLVHMNAAGQQRTFEVDGLSLDNIPKYL